MKQVYMNSRLHSLPVGVSRGEPREWIFALGERWLLLTPPRLRRLASALGLADGRVARLLGAVRRWHPHPERFGPALGVRIAPQIRPRDYPPAVCPLCDRVHNPHPEDAPDICPDCLAKTASLPDTALAADRRLDLRVRSRMLRENPDAFGEGALNPFRRVSARRRLERDWNSAINRILLGSRYREVAREFDCSVGLLHKKVSEARHWEWN